jgi:hypothetical protein
MFDLLLRQAAQHTTRRASLGALVGGALLLTHQGEGAATRKAERRRKRKRKQRKRKDPHVARLHVSAIIDNSQGEAPVTVEWGWVNETGACCGHGEPFTLQPGERATINAPEFQLWAWIGDMYWFRFYNDWLFAPSVGIAIYGKLRRGTNCCDFFPGETVTANDEMKPNQVNRYWIERRALFTVTRKPDMRTRKLFELLLPPVIPSGPPTE